MFRFGQGTPSLTLGSDEEKMENCNAIFSLLPSGSLFRFVLLGCSSSIVSLQLNSQQIQMQMGRTKKEASKNVVI